jgi:hypothetical protein
MPRAVYSVDFANTKNNVAVGSGDGSIRIFSIRAEGQAEDSQRS